MKDRFPTIQPERFTPLFGPEKGDDDFQLSATPNLQPNSGPRPYEISSSFDDRDTTSDPFNGPVESASAYPSRLAELKERGGNKLRQVLKLGGSAISKTIQIARNLIPSREQQSDAYQPTYETGLAFGHSSSYDDIYDSQPSSLNTYTGPTESVGGSIRGIF